MRTLDEYLAWLESLHPKAIDLGLDRVIQLAELLGLNNKLCRRRSENRSFRTVVVAGTNGKGSSVACMASILGVAGYKVGCYTSPHLLSFNERIVIDGEPVDDERLLSSFDAIEAVRNGITLSYFEYTTLAALLIFLESNLDVLLLEVGLGGRLDAVNIVDSDVALITSIALDHQEWLGEDVESIGFEKAGILRAAKPAIFSGQYLPKSVALTAEKLSSPLLVANRDFECSRKCDEWSWSGLDADGQTIQYQHLPLPNILLANAAGAIQVLHYLGLELTEQHFVDGLKHVKILGRAQKLQWRGITVILDVGHNPAAAVELANGLADNSGKTRVLLAIMADKDVSGFVRALMPVVDDFWLLALLGVDRALKMASLEKILVADGGIIAGSSSDISDAMVKQLETLKPGDCLIVTGSFITVSLALRYFSMQDDALYE